MSVIEKIKEYDIPVVETIPPFENINSLVEYIHDLTNAEGVVLAFADGHRVKIKAAEYLRIHKCLDRIVYDRNIVNLILNEGIDDVLPMLPKVQAARVHDFANCFANRLHALVENYERYWNTVVASGISRKQYAQEWMPSIKHNDPFAPQYVFGRFQGRDGREMILQHIEKNISTNAKWDQCAKWMGLNNG